MQEPCEYIHSDLEDSGKLLFDFPFSFNTKLNSLQGIVYIVDTIPVKILAEAMEELEDNADFGDEDEEEPPVLLDDKELVELLRDEVRKARLE